MKIVKRISIIIIMMLLLTGCENNANNLAPLPSTTNPPMQIKVENKALGTYSTKLLDKKKPRLRNIDVAIKAINKVTLQPGETFSFNNTVGPRTAERGYEKALIIIKKEKALGYGGGICQVSTTMYNAAIGAGLEIVERHEHDNEVGYVKLGDDATVNYGSLDLKIKNNMDTPISFRLSVGKDTIDAMVVTVK